VTWAFPSYLSNGLRRRLRDRVGAVEALREAWSRYPGEWQRDAALSRGVRTLGEEWGGAEFADLVVELVGVYLGPDVDVLELGCGGGKFSQRLAPRCRSLVCADISEQMLKHAQATLDDSGIDANVSYVLLDGVDFAGVPDRSLDFIFSYDVQLHLQPENVFSYMLDARRVLRDGGVLMVHQVRLASDGGMDHFLGQFRFGSWRMDYFDPRRRGFMHFMSSEELRALADAGRLAVEWIVEDFPPIGSPLRPVTHGRDLIGFLKLMPSRLRDVAPASARLVRAQGEATVYAVLDGRRVAFASERQFTSAGFHMCDVQELPAEELALLPLGESLDPLE
jgi:ubiquinone/menaquinone biosynthesis C-methylase UbiE